MTLRKGRKKRSHAFVGSLTEVVRWLNVAAARHGFTLPVPRSRDLPSPMSGTAPSAKPKVQTLQPTNHGQESLYKEGENSLRLLYHPHHLVMSDLVLSENYKIFWVVHRIYIFSNLGKTDLRNFYWCHMSLW